MLARIFLLFLLLIPLTIAQTDFMENAPLISPPELPSASPQTLFLLEGTNGGIISDSHVEILTKDGTTLRYLVDNRLHLPPSEKPVDITLKIDNSNTLGKDYYFSGTISTKRDQTLKVYPVGSLQGLVQDDQGYVIPYASISIHCSSNYGEQIDTKTDEYGEFHYSWLPLGRCRISAIKDSRVGFADSHITKGNISTSTLTLSGELKEKNAHWIYYVLLLLTVAILLYFYLKPRKANTPEESQTPLNSKRINDILQTLSPNERKVSEFLLQNDNCYQNKIIHATSIPKTSIVRIFSSLEQKQIIKIEKQGKVKKIHLTPWFLGKTEK